jgi:betaine-aldehyde dehydrogenase
MTRVVRNFVNGELVDAADGRTTDLIDPSTGEVFGNAPLSSMQDVSAAYGAASKAFETGAIPRRASASGRC